MDVRVRSGFNGVMTSAAPTADAGAEGGGVPRHDIPTAGRSGFTLVEGRQIHYLEWGHGGLPPVLCLHGGGQTAYMYEEVGSALGHRYHLLAPDLPNHGDSDSMAEGFGPKGIAETLPPLLDAFGMQRVALVGASLGGIGRAHV